LGDAVRAAHRPLQELLRGDRHYLRFLGGDVPDGDRAHPRAAAPLQGREAHRLRSDSLWYGSPQWQIEALWRFQIPERIAEKWDYPQLDEDDKRNILGRNSGKLYGLEPRSGAAYGPLPSNFESRITDDLKRLWEMAPYDKTQNLEAKKDNFNVYRDRYLAMGVEPRQTRYGWIRTSL